MEPRDRYRKALEEAEQTSYILEIKIAARKYPGIIVDIIEGHPGLLCVFSREGQFIIVSPEWVDYLGWERAELQGKNIIDFVHPEDREVTLSAMGYSLDGEVPKPFINRYKTKSGGYKWVYWHPAKPAHNKNTGVAFANKLKSVPDDMQAGFIGSKDQERLSC